MHRGRAYHEFILGSARNRRAREQFQRLVYRFAPERGTILDFGAGTGIDAKAYAHKKFRVLVYEPCEENRAFLGCYCRDELRTGDIAFASLTENGLANLIAADFAVLNLVADHRGLFATFNRLLAPNGFVVVSLLNPFFAGDARYAWWWANIGALLRNGGYVVEGNDGIVHRFTAAAVAEAARPEFSRVVLRPFGVRLGVRQYMFIVFQKTL